MRLNFEQKLTPGLGVYGCLAIEHVEVGKPTVTDQQQGRIQDEEPGERHCDHDDKKSTNQKPTRLSNFLNDRKTKQPLVKQLLGMSGSYQARKESRKTNFIFYFPEVQTLCRSTAAQHPKHLVGDSGSGYDLGM